MLNNEFKTIQENKKVPYKNIVVSHNQTDGSFILLTIESKTIH